MTCVFSTLSFVSEQAQLLRMPTACITFDQPLWQKAVETVHSSGLGTVCHLTSFHPVINFLGAVGSIMSGCRLGEKLQVCFGPVSVTHMLTGKAFAKAVRGHLLLESAWTWFWWDLSRKTQQKMMKHITYNLLTYFRHSFFSMSWILFFFTAIHWFRCHKISWLLTLIHICMS